MSSPAPITAAIPWPAPPRWHVAMQAALLVVAAWLIYAPVIRGEWLWDDALELSQNPEITGAGGLAKIWLEPAHADYFPLKSTVQWFAWRIWGNHPAGYHALNLGLHVLSGLLVWRLFARLRLSLAWLGGLLFVVHPLAVESVAWIAELKNTLALPPLLLAFCAYVTFDETGRRSRYGAALAWFLASLLCKTSGVMLPVVLLVYHWWKAGRLTGRNLRALLPFFLISLVLGLVTIHFQHTRAIATTPVAMGGPLERIAIAGLAAAFYTGKVFAPLNLVPVYPRWQFESLDAMDFLPWVGAAGIFALAWRHRRTWGRHALFGLGAFLALVAPVLGFVAMSYLRYAWVADHFVYLPMLGLIGLATAGLGALGAGEPGRRRMGQGVGVALAVVLLILSRRHAEVFRDPTALWTYTLRHNPTARAAHNSLGSALQNSGRHVEAVRHFEQAIADDPQFASPRNNLGVSLSALGRPAEAVAQFRAALQLDPNDAVARSNLGNVLAQDGRVEEAIAEYRAALKVQPTLLEARANLANALYLGGRTDEALEELARVLAARPDYAEAWNNAGKIHMRAGRAAEAIRHYERAVQHAPRNAAFLNDLGFAFATAGRLPEAAARLEEALRLQPGLVNARINLGGVRYQAGDLPGAIAQYEAALKLDSNSREARQNLSVLRAQGGGALPPPR